jgi:hypothetical protein
VPSFTNQVANLVAVGPIVEVFIGPSQLFAQTAATRGETVPAAVKALGMIDTGASGTVVTPGVVQQLGISPVGVTPMRTPSTTAPVLALQFNVSLSFPNGVFVPSIIALQAPLGGQPIQCLIGRDVLQHAWSRTSATSTSSH